MRIAILTAVALLALGLAARDAGGQEPSWARDDPTLTTPVEGANPNQCERLPTGRKRCDHRAL